MIKPTYVFSVLFGFFSVAVFAGTTIGSVPESVDTEQKYVFYLHGQVEEYEGSTEKYETALEAIADSSATVISEVREEGTEPSVYASKVKSQVTALMAKGVPAENITISGFSKGAIIALAAASIIDQAKVNYVLLAGCSGFLNRKYGVQIASVKGRILSIYDADDEKFGSCNGMIGSLDSVTFEEIELNSGKGHKLFRIPKEKFIEQWRDPLTDWAGA